MDAGRRSTDRLSRVWAVPSSWVRTQVAKHPNLAAVLLVFVLTRMAFYITAFFGNWMLPEAP